MTAPPRPEAIVQLYAELLDAARAASETGRATQPEACAALLSATLDAYQRTWGAAAACDALEAAAVELRARIAAPDRTAH
jgi:hypothetical protein